MPSYLKTIKIKNKIYNEWRMKTLIENSLMPKCKRVYMSASSTIEASLIMPIFIYAIIAIMYIIQFISFYINVEISIYNTARKIATGAYEISMISHDKNDIYNNESMGKTAISALIISDLKNNNVLNSNVVGGSLGISSLHSAISEDEITIIVNYMLKSPFDIFKLSLIPVTQKVSTKPWVGISTDGGDAKDNKYVYVTQDGSVYHKSKQCTYLTINIEETYISNISIIRNDSGGRYYACQQCASGNLSDSTKVYISKYGDRYHVDLKCARIKRDILTIDIKNIGNRRKCSKCY